MPPRRRPKVGGVRAGAGRPPLGDYARSETFRVRTTPSVAVQVKSAAKETGQTLSDWGLEAFEMAIARGRGSTR